MENCSFFVFNNSDNMVQNLIFTNFMQICMLHSKPYILAHIKVKSSLYEADATENSNLESYSMNY